MQTGDEELRKQMEAATAKTVAIDAVFFVAGKAVKYLAKKFELKIWEKWSAEIRLNPDLLDELASSGVKYNPDDVIMVTKNVEGKLMWLEKGNSKAGLEHILAGHEEHFANKGIKDIPDFLQYLLNTEPLKIGSNKRGFFAEYVFANNKYRVAYGTNGFIVSFYPLD